MKKTLIILSKDKDSVSEVSKELKGRDFSISPLSDCEKAYSTYQENPCSAFLIDVDYFNDHAEKLIARLNSEMHPPAVFVKSSKSDPETIIYFMKMGIDDYFIKPLNGNNYIESIDSAVTKNEIERTVKIAEKEKLQNLESMLEWYKWEERAKNRDKTSMSESIFHSLQLNFNRPAGIGALVTLMEIIGTTSEKDGDKYIVDEDIFDAAMSNAEISKKTIEIFSGIDYMMGSELDFEDIDYKKFREFIISLINEVKPFAKHKNNSIIINENLYRSYNPELKIERNRFASAIREVLINAIKFSLKGSTIYVFTQVKDNSVEISVFNEPFIDESGIVGIPVEYANLVFEPFFRITKNVQAEYETLEVGLGLALVEKVVKKHNGEINMTNISDFTDINRDPVTKVHLFISLPVN